MKNNKIKSLAKMKKLVIKFFICTLFTFFYGCSNEAGQDWTYIFDGETFNGWHSYGEDKIGNQWSINNGELIFTNDENESGQDILTKKEYTSFELSLEWNVSKGGNSGIFYGVKDSKIFCIFDWSRNSNTRQR